MKNSTEPANEIRNKNKIVNNNIAVNSTMKFNKIYSSLTQQIESGIENHNGFTIAQVFGDWID